LRRYRQRLKIVSIVAALCQWAWISGEYPRRIVQNVTATRLLQTAIGFQTREFADFYMPSGRCTTIAFLVGESRTCAYEQYNRDTKADRSVTRGHGVNLSDPSSGKSITSTTR
jgi:hypothetical protein